MPPDNEVILALIGATAIWVAVVRWGEKISTFLLQDRATQRLEATAARQSSRNREDELNLRIDRLREEIDAWQERYYQELGATRDALSQYEAATREIERMTKTTELLQAQIEAHAAENQTLKAKLAEVEAKLEDFRQTVNGGPDVVRH